MKNFIIAIFLLNIFYYNLFAFEKINKNSVDCIMLKDENSIICKYIHDRLEYDKKIMFKWFSPNGKISRQREVLIQAGHGSAYDFRYIQGRFHGTWKLEVIDGNNTYKTNFIIE